VIYSDASGKPEALLGATEQLTFKSTNTAGWYDLQFASPVKLAAGNYWIGVMTGATAGVTGFRYDSVAGARAWNANPYASGPTNPSERSPPTASRCRCTRRTSQPARDHKHRRGARARTEFLEAAARSCECRASVEHDHDLAVPADGALQLRLDRCHRGRQARDQLRERARLASVPGG